jgi:two-component system, sensor histidine kinase and response regulator
MLPILRIKTSILLLTTSFIFVLSSSAQRTLSEMEQLLKKSDPDKMEQVFKQLHEIVGKLPYREAILYEDSLLHTAASLPHYAQAFSWIYELIKGTYNNSGHQDKLFLYLLSMSADPAFDKPEILQKISYETGSSYYNIGDYGKALVTLEKYITNYSGINNRDLINSFTILGIISQKQQKFDLALHYLHLALEKATLLNDSIWIGLSNGNIGSLYMDMGKFNEAIPLIYKDIDLCLEESLYESAANNFSDLSYIALKQGQLRRARVVLDSGLIMLRLDNRPYRKSWALIYQNFARYFKETGRTDSAYHYLLLAQQIKDSLQNDQSESLLKLKLTAFTQQKEDEDALLIKASIDSSRQNRRFAFTAIFSLIVVAGFSLMYIHQKKRINSMLREKARQVEIEKMEEEALRKKEEAANRAKNKLFSLIAHDLRGPISSLGMLLEFLQEGYMNHQEFQRFLPKVKDRVDNLYKVTDNLLLWAYSQFEGNITIKEPVRVASVVDNVLKLLNDDAAKKEIDLQTKIAADLTIVLDANQLEIVIRNLVSNALKFSQSGSIVIIEGFIKDNEAIINIIDNGPGLPQEVILNMQGGKFSQPSFGTRGERGAGLGLVMCKEFVEANGGKITAFSNIPAGTVFSLSFPIN